MPFQREPQRRVIHRHQVDDDDVDRTKQEFAEVADIRNIADRYLRTGMAPVVDREAIYGDFSNVGDYMDARNRLLAAEESYGNLPLHIRDRFSGIPELVAFAADDANLDQAVELGVVSRAEALERGWTPPVEAREDAAAEPQPEPSPQGDTPA